MLYIPLLLMARTGRTCNKSVFITTVKSSSMDTAHNGWCRKAVAFRKFTCRPTGCFYNCVSSVFSTVYLLPLNILFFCFFLMKHCVSFHPQKVLSLLPLIPFQLPAVSHPWLSVFLYYKLMNSSAGDWLQS